MSDSAIEVWIVIDDQGNYVASHISEDHAFELYAGDTEIETNRRCFKLSLTVPLPVTRELDLTLPDDPSGTRLRIV